MSKNNASIDSKKLMESPKIKLNRTFNEMMSQSSDIYDHATPLSKKETFESP